MVDDSVLYVEDFQYLISNARGSHVRSICPICNERRSNKRDKCLSIDVTNLLYHCHYCNAKGKLRSKMSEVLSKEQRMFKPKKIEYVKPKPKDKEKEKVFGDSFLEYFKNRGISEKTLLEARVTQETEYFHDIGKAGAIAFNFYVGEELVNVKFRSRDKHFKLVSGAELVPYNINSIMPESYKDGEEKIAIITEGECFDDKAKILTENGWKLFSELSKDDKVAQYDGGKIEFVKPLAHICKHFEGDLIQYSKQRNNYYSLTTPNHNLVVERGRQYKMLAKDINSQINVVRSAMFDGEGISLKDDELRLFCAISADFTIRESGDIYGAFKRPYKIKRIVEILDRLNLRYSNNIDSRGYNSIFIHRGQNIFAQKDFPFEWIGKLSQHQIKIILEEVVIWDGNEVKGRTMTEYNSNRIHNVQFIQTLCHLSNMRSVICKRSNRHGTWYKCTMINKRTSSISREHRTNVPYNGNVYCVSVPSGKIMVKQNDLITISGNCDTLTWIECGFKHVISLPNGANNLGGLDNFIESVFDKLDLLYISVDNDTKGIECRNEILRRFGKENCKIIEYPSPCKDINEVMVEYGAEKVIECFKNATDLKPDGIQELVDVESELDYLFKNGLQKGAMVNIPSVDKILSFKTGMLTVVTGVPSHGKTYLLNYLLVRLNLLHNWKMAFFSPEFYPVSLHISQVIETIGGKRFESANYNQMVYEKMKNYLCSNMFWIDPNDTDISSVMERAKYLIKKRGIKVLVIDPFNALTDKERKNQKQDEYISDFLQKLRWFARKYDVSVFLVMHPIKQSKLENGLYPVCDLYSCKGAAEIFDKADCGLTVWRNEKEDYAELHVTKIKFRHLGEKGFATFKFNVNNGRYVEIGEADELRKKGIDIKTMQVEWDNSNYILEKERGNQVQSNIVYEETIQPNTSFYQPVQIEEPTQPPLRSDTFSSYIPKEYIEPQIPNDYDDDCPF